MRASMTVPSMEPRCVAEFPVEIDPEPAVIPYNYPLLKHLIHVWHLPTVHQGQNSVHNEFRTSAGIQVQR
jgi:hypothetical protein